MIFANAQYLLLLLLIPVFFILYAVKVAMDKRRIRKFGDEELVAQNMPSRSKSKGWVRITLLAIAFFFFVIGLSRPQIGAKLREQQTKGVEIMIALDVSNSMLAEDYSPNRLERAKLALSRLVESLREDRIGMVVFAGTSYVQLPITTDYVSAKMFLSSINTECVAVQGTCISEAIMTCGKSFSAQSENSRAIILITDGEDHEGEAIEAAALVASEKIRVYTIGVGSPEGQPIPINGELLKDKDGNIVVTRLNEELLMEIANAGGGKYVHAGTGEFGLNPIVDDIKAMDAEEYTSVVFEEFDEQYMYFFALALIFFVIEMLVGERRARRRLFS